MLHAADCAIDIEQATEASLTMVTQSIALMSGVIENDDYLIDFITVSGKRIKMIHQGIHLHRGRIFHTD